MTIEAATRRSKFLGLAAGLVVAFVTAPQADDPWRPAADSSARIQTAGQKIDAGDFRRRDPVVGVTRSELNLMGFGLRKTGKLTEALQYY